jgi:hypothetical protein
MSLRRNWFWLAALAASALIATLWIGLREKPMYRAESTIELEAPAGADIASSRAYVEAQLQILQSDKLLSKAANKAGLLVDQGTLLDAARARLTIGLDGSSAHGIQIVSRSHDPKEAADLGSAVIGAYTDELKARDADAAAKLAMQVKASHALLESAETRLLEFEVDATPMSPAEHKQRYDALIQDTNSIQATYEDVLSRPDPQTGIRVVERAHATAEPSNANPWWDLGFAVAMLALGGILFFVSRTRMLNLIESAINPNIQIPFKMQAGASGSQIVALSNAGGGRPSPETLLDFVESLVSPGRTVLVVDCEVSATLSESAGLKGATGLSDFLMNSYRKNGSPMPAWKSNRQGVFIMPAGTKPHRIPALLAKSGAGDAITSLGFNYAHVVINAPSILTAGEMRDLTPQIDGVLLVTPVERSAGLTNDAVRQVEEYGGRVLGMVEDSPQFAAV